MQTTQQEMNHMESVKTALRMSPMHTNRREHVFTHTYLLVYTKRRVKLQVGSEGAGTAQAVEEVLCCCLGAQSCPTL